MRRMLPLLILLAIWAPCAAAQSTDPATKELIEKLLARIDGLEKRVAELESERTPAPTAPTLPPANAPTPTPTPTPTAAARPLSAAEAVHQSHDQAPAPQIAGSETARVYPS